MKRKDIINNYREKYPAHFGLNIDFDGCVIEVQVNTRELQEELADYFKEFITVKKADILITAHECPPQDLGIEYTVKQPDPGKTKIKEEFFDLEDGRIVYKRLTGMIFVFGNGENAAIGPCLENSNQVINFINNRFIEYMLNKGCFLGHAAGVELDGRGIALAGFSGMGKSTLALHLMSLGTNFISNDRVMVDKADKGLTFYGVAKQPRINPGTALNNPDLHCVLKDSEREKFLTLPPDELWNLEHKYDALIDQCYGENKFHLSAPMNGLVILNWNREEKTTVINIVNPADRQDLLPAFMKSTGLFYLPDSDEKQNDPDIAAYTELLSETTIIEICGGVDFELAANACLDFLKTGDLNG
ncbi:HprK-related kinase B [Maridesulfovibrio bastinii]|uniref:HprK-related kinase B n=1 Tax=Maridesulfovibrio bastinii TaxID=47157 RepID=UPI0003F9F5E5|nr:HprK-related kinase B [Maridesulfovibrio bastinii]